MIGPTMTSEQALHIVQAALTRVAGGHKNSDLGESLEQVAMEIGNIKRERMAGIYKEDDAAIG